MLILDKTELVKLTGYIKKGKQCQVLREMGVPFAIRMDGQPIVTADAVHEFTGLSIGQAEEKATLNLG